ncbi:ABC transporter ATP-binding protein [Agrobacterium sp. T29]|uniref:ABC transporter ATP-binding protein n=1 Tax=Agrobacterium sp. T29 TaxID=2580515 RepID=UPI00115C4496|nr:oligopeptide/dipeptide ABC transporter ATP-binding protein [Agrobacterium sp. T29]
MTISDGTQKDRAGEPVLSVKNLVKEYAVRRNGLFRLSGKPIQAVSDVSFNIGAGQAFGLVGESGCGKSTLGRCILHLTEITSGSILYKGVDIAHLSESEMRPFRSSIQMVFQDPYASLHPRMKAGDIVAEPLRMTNLSASEKKSRVEEALSLVKLGGEYAIRYPHEFSGGQRQRIGIARALVARPEFIVLDEPVSALDVSIQAGVLNLLKDLQHELALSYLFIAHDLAVVRHLCDHVAVMYLGKIVEIGSREEIYESPKHPYTRALLSAVPVPSPAREKSRNRIVLRGELPTAANPPSGCRFRTRCWKAQEICAQIEPLLGASDDSHKVACHFPETGGIASPVPAARVQVQ